MPDENTSTPSPLQQEMTKRGFIVEGNSFKSSGDDSKEVQINWQESGSSIATGFVDPSNDETVSFDSPLDNTPPSSTEGDS